MANFSGIIYDDTTDWGSQEIPEDAIHIDTVDTESGYINFTGANLTGASFDGITLENVLFDQTNLDGTTFEGTTLTNVIFTNSENMDEDMFNNSTLNNVTIGSRSNINTPESAKIAIQIKTNPQLYFSTALADPYIYPMRSSIPVKLPDAEACYRLYQSKETFINAEVAIATKEHGNRMMEFVEKLGYETNDVIADGYFFSKFFIADGKNKMVVDLREKSFSLLEGSDKDFFHLSENNNNAGNKDWNGKAKNVVVQWVTEEGNQMKATVSFFANPHIENGISLSVTNLPQKALGLCVSNYRPKLMCVPSLITEKHAKIAKQVKKSRNPFQKIAIQSNREKWVMKK